MTKINKIIKNEIQNEAPAEPLVSQPNFWAGRKFWFILYLCSIKYGLGLILSH